MPFPLKGTTRNHSQIIRTDRSKVATTRSTIDDDLKFWVRFQNHKCRCLYSTNLDRRVHKFGAACGHISKYYKR